jgi:hypothetical protein
MNACRVPRLVTRYAAAALPDARWALNFDWPTLDGYLR